MEFNWFYEKHALFMTFIGLIAAGKVERYSFLFLAEPPNMYPAFFGG